ncbi:Hypothetical_protein [Hexamita inflata]|nr:Hypothetical protein HINF_LOCUS43508 [Hexamita inflata]
MMISGKERGSVQDNWSKNTKIRNQFIADEVGMSCREWEEIHSNVCYGHIKLLLDQPEEEIDTNLDGKDLVKNYHKFREVVIELSCLISCVQRSKTKENDQISSSQRCKRPLMVMQKVENFNHDIYKIKICEITLLNVRICKFSWYSQRTT